jgi:hypothetical protein
MYKVLSETTKDQNVYNFNVRIPKNNNPSKLFLFDFFVCLLIEYWTIRHNIWKEDDGRVVVTVRKWSDSFWKRTVEFADATSRIGRNIFKLKLFLKLCSSQIKYAWIRQTKKADIQFYFLKNSFHSIQQPKNKILPNKDKMFLDFVTIISA